MCNILITAEKSGTVLLCRIWKGSCIPLEKEIVRLIESLSLCFFSYKIMYYLVKEEL